MNYPAPIRQPADKRVNGVSVYSRFKTIEALRETPSLGLFSFRARNLWLDGGHTRSSVKDFHGLEREQSSRRTPIVVDTDLPAAFDGDDRGATPVEHLLVALTSCVTTTLVSQAAMRDIHVEAVDIQAEGDIDLRGFLGIDKNVRRGYREIRMHVLLEADAGEAELDSIVELGTAYSPVFATISCGTKMIVSRETRRR